MCWSKYLCRDVAACCNSSCTAACCTRADSLTCSLAMVPPVGGPFYAVGWRCPGKQVSLALLCRYLMTGAGFSPTRRSLFDRLFGTLDDGGSGASSYAEPQPGDFGYSGERWPLCIAHPAVPCILCHSHCPMQSGGHLHSCLTVNNKFMALSDFRP